MAAGNGNGAQPTLWDRLWSLAADAVFVKRVAARFSGCAVVPNPRCGLWYCEAPDQQIRVYFLSKDGHPRTAGLSLRRLNLPLVEAAQRLPGCLLVDATHNARKEMPDSLSKTVPIWCCAINRVVQRGARASGNAEHPAVRDDWDTALHTSRCSVTEADHADLAARMEALVDSLIASSSPNLVERLVACVRRPLRPLWVTPRSFAQGGTDERVDAAALPYWPVVCVSASGDGPPHDLLALEDDDAAWKQRAFAYVKGAGDDHESWAGALTPELFWAHRDALLRCADAAALHAAISEIARSAPPPAPCVELARMPDAPVALASFLALERDPPATTPFALLLVTEQSLDGTAVAAQVGAAGEADVCIVRSPPGKRAKAGIAAVLDAAEAFALPQAARGRLVIIASTEAMDVPGAIALTLMLRTGTAAVVDKNAVRRAVVAMATACPDVHVNRALLTAVNRRLMSGEYESAAKRQRRGSETRAAAANVPPVGATVPPVGANVPPVGATVPPAANEPGE